ncbi:MAG TPA: hypothetical protein PLJ34_05760 [Hyphomicrobiales bacterium]|nr:hypothetical protein [Kaistiaceae bacterium]HQF30934.1 hypothetical protein [Hyphomicrobiales bacterium]
MKDDGKIDLSLNEQELLATLGHIRGQLDTAFLWTVAFGEMLYQLSATVAEAEERLGGSR